MASCIRKTFVFRTYPVEPSPTPARMGVFCTTNPAGMIGCAETSRSGVCRACWSGTCAFPPPTIANPSTCSATRSPRPASTSVISIRIAPRARKDDRPGLKACLADLRSGDVLVVWKLDRLGRSLPNLLDIITDLKGGASASAR